MYTNIIHTPNVNSQESTHHIWSQYLLQLEYNSRFISGLEF